MKIWICFTSLVTLVLFAASPAQCVTKADQTEAIDAYNRAFYTVTNGVGNYVVDASTGDYPTQGQFWKMAEKFEMLEDAYDATKSQTYSRMCDELYNGFVQVNGTDWSWNAYNDDICWACIACIRAYRITGNEACLHTALTNYNMMWNRANDHALGGGLWWSTDKTGKNACVEGPAAIVGALLYQCGQGQVYQDRAREILTWEIDKLYKPNGVVADHMTSDGIVQGGATTYNQGTFIGACDLVDINDGNKRFDEYAMSAANFVRNRMTGRVLPGVINPSYGQGQGGIDNAGFNGIFARWVCRWVKDSGHPEYAPWLLRNGDAAWSDRNAADLDWGLWGKRTPNDTPLSSWECSNSVVIIESVPVN